MVTAASRRPSSPARDKAPARAEATALPEVLQFMRMLWRSSTHSRCSRRRCRRCSGSRARSGWCCGWWGFFSRSITGGSGGNPSPPSQHSHRRAPAPREPGPVAAIDQHRSRSSQSVLVLTPKGRRVNGSRKGTVERAVQETLEQVAPSNLAATKTVLSRLARCLTDSARC